MAEGQNIIVPILSITGGVVAWLVFITFLVFALKERVAVKSATDETLSNKIIDLKSDMNCMKAELKEDFSVRMDKFELHVNARFDSFFAQVIQGLMKKGG
jgi:hypothetical protein